MSGRRRADGDSLFPGLFEDGESHTQGSPGKAASETAEKKPARVRQPAADPSLPRIAVALAKPLPEPFTYAVPRRLADAALPGCRVLVPFGSRSEVGVVVARLEGAGPKELRLREILAVLDEEPVVDPPLLDLARWIGEEYACSWGEALAAILPAPMKRAKGARLTLRVRVTSAANEAALLDLETRAPAQHRLLRTLLEIDGEVELRVLERKLEVTAQVARALAAKGLCTLRSAPVENFPEAQIDPSRRRPEQLSDGQSFALDMVSLALRMGKGKSFLLQGVTGSGKTEVYLVAIERALALGRGAIVLVPEIALTPQTVGWFRSRFADVAVLHSGMSDPQRLAMWKRVRRGDARVVVGARSAVFAPVRDLGVIVVDEEHEPSFKQAQTPRYHAREVALMRAKLEGAVCILGSATPALESWAAAKAGEHTRLLLEQRVGAGRMPRVDIVDLRTEPGGPAGGLFSRPLRQRLADTLARGEQAILFLNRRGYTPVLWCGGCRSVVRCEQCDAPMTLHRRIGRIVCHLCAAERAIPKDCPMCTAPGLGLLGAGSERVEGVLAKLFPSARIRRMDSDTMHRREDYEATLGAFGRGEIDVLVGTQMIAKGLDFPRVTLVGIVDADTSLHLADFRASERTFQLIAQVAGRAGRGELEGHIVVQTSSPEHPAIRAAARHDFEAFAAHEVELRRELGYPPAGRVLRAVFEDEEEARAASAADSIAQRLRAVLSEAEGCAAAVVLGPAQAPIAKLRGRFRHHLLVKAPRAGPSFATARATLRQLIADLGARPRALIDVDPMALL